MTVGPEIETQKDPGLRNSVAPLGSMEAAEDAPRPAPITRPALPAVENSDGADALEDTSEAGEEILESHALQDAFQDEDGQSDAESDAESEADAAADAAEGFNDDFDAPLVVNPKGDPGALERPASEHKNPIRRRFSRDFLGAVPKRPGIYTFVAEDGSTLYVGKAKNLKSRMRAYWHSRPRQMPRKLFKLLNLVDDIKWEVCANEKESLQRENALLRTLKPAFNVVEKRPEDFYYLGVRVLGDFAGAEPSLPGDGVRLQFRLTSDSSIAKMTELGQFFGAFKGRSTVREGYQALLRLLWATTIPKNWARTGGFEHPSRLTKRVPVYVYEMKLSPQLLIKLHGFLNGSDRSLITGIADLLLQADQLPAFVYGWIEEDFRRLDAFFEQCLRKNFELRQTLGLRTQIVPQEQLEGAPAEKRDH